VGMTPTGFRRSL